MQQHRTNLGQLLQSMQDWSDTRSSNQIPEERNLSSTNKSNLSNLGIVQLLTTTRSTLDADKATSIDHCNRGLPQKGEYFCEVFPWNSPGRYPELRDSLLRFKSPLAVSLLQRFRATYIQPVFVDRTYYYGVISLLGRKQKARHVDELMGLQVK